VTEGSGRTDFGPDLDDLDDHAGTTVLWASYETFFMVGDLCEVTGVTPWSGELSGASGHQHECA
jgi:hypothetical protein